MGAGSPGRCLAAAFALAAALSAPSGAAAQRPGSDPMPIPQDPAASEQPEYVGRPATARRVRQRWRVPRHPRMAPNERSNLHNDAYMTDTYRRRGPLGVNTEATSTLFFRECASVTFDSAERLETICVGLDRPVLALLDPESLDVLASFELPPRQPGTANPFTNFSGGGYFYLDHRDRAVIPTTTRHVYVVGQTPGPGFELVADHDLSEALPSGDAIISVLPDWRGRIWFASIEGRVGWIGRREGAVTMRELGEGITNSFAVDESGGVFIVTDTALYRLQAGGGEVEVAWRRRYRDSGIHKPGQSDAGSGTTPTLVGRRGVAITDNADPMNVAIYRRGAASRGRLLCREPLFERGASATDQSLIAAGRALIAENNYGYTGPLSTNGGGVTTPGLQRVDFRRGRCETVWRSEEIAPSVVPKASLGAGLVYTYTKPQTADDTDAWYFTALDFRTGETVFKRLAGTGFGYNNNFAPVTIGPDGAAYVGVLGGLTRFADQ
jgi:hypothetical protein